MLMNFQIWPCWNTYSDSSKFIYFETVTKFCEISTVDWSVTTSDKSTVEILQKFVAFSEYMNFNKRLSSLSYRVTPK